MTTSTLGGGAAMDAWAPGSTDAGVDRDFENNPAAPSTAPGSLASACITNWPVYFVTHEASGRAPASPAGLHCGGHGPGPLGRRGHGGRGDPHRLPQQVRDGPRHGPHRAGPDAVHR